MSFSCYFLPKLFLKCWLFASRDCSCSQFHLFCELLTTQIVNTQQIYYSNPLHFNMPGKFRYQLEIPDKVLARSTPDDYHLKSQRKGFKRFRTDFIEEKLIELVDAEDRRDAALKDTMRNIFHIFDEK